MGSLLERMRRAFKCLVDKSTLHAPPRARLAPARRALTRVPRVAEKDAAGKSTANYLVDLDRGYGHVEAQQRAWEEDGIYTHAMMDADRVGLPRRWIAEAAKELGDCPAGCDHKEGATGCRKYMFTAVHKDVWELTLWQDNKLIVSYGNFHSSARAGELARGAHGDAESFRVWAPEGIHHYNIEGRSPTDASDQDAKKLDISERRTVRNGVKGMLWVINRALGNAATMKRFLQPASTKQWRLDQQHSKVCAPPSSPTACYMYPPPTPSSPPPSPPPPSPPPPSPPPPSPPPPSPPPPSPPPPSPPPPSPPSPPPSFESQRTCKPRGWGAL